MPKGDIKMETKICTMYTYEYLQILVGICVQTENESTNVGNKATSRMTIP